MKHSLYLPLLTFPDAFTETVLANAVDLANNLDTTIHATVVGVTIPPVINPWPIFIDTDEMIRQAESKSRRQGEVLADTLRKRCDEASVAMDLKTIIVAQPDAIDVVVESARLHDVVLTQSKTEFTKLTEALIFGTGRPVILYPDRMFSGRIEHVAIAWDGSRAAARALADAAIFIDRSARVSVVCVTGEKPLDESAAKILVGTLRSQGVNAELCLVQAIEESIGDAIQSQAQELRADLLVMGGYGHSRLREFVLGGATSDVLANTRLPILISH